MNFADNPLIRRTLAPQPFPDQYAEPRERLWRALLQFRERAATLANEIHRDLPHFTVHDITHLDALWEMADLIAGPDYPLNPLEAFALGAVFLLHDLGLGLAAYPGGLDELKKGPGWQDALSTYLRKHLERVPTAEELASPPPEVERMAVQERLRVLHAERAERLALASWRHKGVPEYHLIEDPDLRLALGPLFGKIAHSHWWPVSRLGNEFGIVRGALANCPRDWTLDPLKVAVLLRTADAAHLDARRAPGFLLALRRPEGNSEDHWRFQNNLLKPRVEDERLTYTTARPFPPEEIDAWWLCEEALRMVDGELYQIDALLADLHRPRLRARGVAGVESPDRLPKYVEVSGWTPIDARLHVSNVADLARKLGGEQLYGNDPTIPLRELIQNAADAVRARRFLENRSSDWGQITMRLGRDDEGPWAEIQDTGLGMSKALLSGPLLDFGTTYWGSMLMREEHEGLWGKGFEPIGRYGIGFFSVFMWGRRVRVITRRYTDGPRDTRVLEFRTGLEARPFMRHAQSGERLRDGGTCIRVWLDKEPSADGGLLRPWHEEDNSEEKSLELQALCAWLAPALDVDLYVEDQAGNHRVVAASDWLTIDGSELFRRVSLAVTSPQEGQIFGPLFRVLSKSSNEILGRAAIIGYGDGYQGQYSSAGVITVGGLRASEVEGVAGIFVGSVTRAARDRAVALADDSVIERWSTEQASLIAGVVIGPDRKMSCALEIVERGGFPGNLPIAKWCGVFLDYAMLSNLTDAPDEIIVCYGYLPKGAALYRNVLWTLSDGFNELIESALAKTWKITGEELIVRTVNEQRQIGFNEDGSSLEGFLTIYKKPASLG
jgi:hypothetical protein